MTRALYRLLILLHPPAFRRRFGSEMLWIFDQTAALGSAAPLFADAFTSLTRQWILRMGLWKAIPAVAGGLLAIFMGLSLPALVLRIVHPPAGGYAEGFMILALFATLFTVNCTAILSVFCFRFTIRRRA